MTTFLDIEFEHAVRILTAHLPISEPNIRKPILFHSVRVGVYLYERNYSREIILAGVLHDALEFSSITEQIVQDEFGDAVLQYVLANTKNDEIANQEEKTLDLVTRCIQTGQDALIVKTADILDSFKFYTKVHNSEQLQYCQRNKEVILKLKPCNFTDKVFDELTLWQ